MASHTIQPGQPAQPIQPSFPRASPQKPEPASIDGLIKALSMTPHVEGGYFVETDRDPLLIRSPFPPQPASSSSSATSLPPQRDGFDLAYRNASTSIFYLLTPSSPQGNFHRNRGRTVHTLHRGRGVYVIIHADEEDNDGACGRAPGKRVETFRVGHDLAAGERLQWIVGGGKFKASFLLPDEAVIDADAEGQEGGAATSEGLLISETVVPGFEYCDHDFLTRDGLKGLVGAAKAEELGWLVRDE